MRDAFETFASRRENARNGNPWSMLLRLVGVESILRQDPAPQLVVWSVAFSSPVNDAPGHAARPAAHVNHRLQAEERPRVARAALRALQLPRHAVRRRGHWQSAPERNCSAVQGASIGAGKRADCATPVTSERDFEPSLTCLCSANQFCNPLTSTGDRGRGAIAFPSGVRKRTAGPRARLQPPNCEGVSRAGFDVCPRLACGARAVSALNVEELYVTVALRLVY